MPLDEIVMVIDAQMPVRAKRIQYFDDRFFKAIHAAQTGELPFPKPGSGGPQGDLPLSVRAMPMAPPSRGGDEIETGSVCADQAWSKTSSTQPTIGNVPKKTAVVVQTVVAEEQLQLEMDFSAQELEADPALDVELRIAVDGLGELEAALKQRV
jgi:type IV secretion system protein VirD4